MDEITLERNPSREQPIHWRSSQADATALAALRLTQNGPKRPILLTGGVVLSMSGLMGDWQKADVLVGGSVIVGVGPGLLTAAADDNMIVINCTGTVVLPSRIDLRNPSASATLAPGELADIAVVRLSDASGTPSGPRVARGQHLDVLLEQGNVVTWDGRPLAGRVRANKPSAADLPSSVDAARVGLWIDETGFVRQELRLDGRYDEARGDRDSAYQGRYWVFGSRITYLDDLGFWAFGEFDGDQLLHAGYRFNRR